MSLPDLLKDVGGVGLYGIGPRVVGELSRGRLVRAGEALGELVFRAARNDARKMVDEIVRTFGVSDGEAHRVARNAYRLRMVTELEVLRYGKLGPHNIDETAVLINRGYLDAAVAAGKGVVVMIGHFGANQMIMPALGHRGYRIHQLSAPPTAWLDIRTDGRANPLWAHVQRRRYELERALPATHIDVFGFVRPAYRCLESNGLLGLAFDGGGGTKWVDVPLGRRRAWVSTQPWQLARATGATIVPTVVLREAGEERHRVIFGEPFQIANSRDREHDIREAATRYAEWFTGWIERYPEHYAPYLLLRRRVRYSDARPFFDDYPPQDP